MAQENLLFLLSQVSNLQRAWNKLSKENKYSHGLSGETIAEFSANLPTHLQSISDRLSKGTYKFSPYRGVPIPKTEGAPRPIKIPEIRDRVVIKAIVELIHPQLSKTFNLNNEASFAYIENRGVKDAIIRMVDLYNQGKKVVLEADIKKFFDSVDRKKLLAEKILPNLSDNSINSLIIDATEQEIGNLSSMSELEFMAFERTKGGIPQGSSISPLLSNICLADFDRRMLSEGFGLIRYADDFILMSKTKEDALRAYDIAIDEIEKKLGLELYHLGEDNSKTRIVLPAREKFSFLSIQFNGKELFPTKEKVMQLSEKIKITTNVKMQKDVLTILRKTNNLLCGWLAAFSYYDSDRYFSQIDELINKELASALRQMNWVFKTRYTERRKIKRKVQECLSKTQRLNSGVQTCESFFREIYTHRKKIDVLDVKSV
jgi:group II intron reverse transcriptase/maturase